MESASTARDNQESPARNSFAITPHATNEVGTIQPRALYVGGSGDITMMLQGDTVATLFTAVPVGVLPVKARIILAVGTTATGIVGLY